MPLLELATGSTLGVALGMRHALEPDHLAAVSTLVGHTLALVVVGVALIALRAELSARLTDIF